VVHSLTASIFALGIMPYISASIVIQLLSIAVPYFQKMQKEGESGRKRINNITRWLTVVITAFQAPGYIVNLRAQVPNAILSVTNPETRFSFHVLVHIDRYPCGRYNIRNVVGRAYHG
jgi:preprotein translocase subunit SecY